MTKRNAMSRKEAIIATILLVIFGTSMHFVHHLPFFNHFWGYIFPVTESVMAHMKMNFYPMLLFAIYLVISRRDIKEFGAPILAGLAVMPVVVLAFYSYWIFVRHEILPLDIVIYTASVVLSVYWALRWRKNETVRRLWPLWIAVAVVTIILTGVLTYHYPDWQIFRDK